MRHRILVGKPLDKHRCLNSTTKELIFLVEILHYIKVPVPPTACLQNYSTEFYMLCKMVLTATAPHMSAYFT
jgi:hypothetical protein